MPRSTQLLQASLQQNKDTASDHQGGSSVGQKDTEAILHGYPKAKTRNGGLIRLGPKYCKKARQIGEFVSGKNMLPPMLKRQTTQQDND